MAEWPNVFVVLKAVFCFKNLFSIHLGLAKYSVFFLCLAPPLRRPWSDCMLKRQCNPNDVPQGLLLNWEFPISILIHATTYHSQIFYFFPPLFTQ